MIRLLAGDFRGEVEASRARMAAVVSVLNHPGHDQKSHGRKGGAGPNTDGIDGSTVIRKSDLVPSGATLSRREEDALYDRSARAIADRWDASQDDKDALMRADNQQWFDETGSTMSPQDRNEAYVRGQLTASGSGVGPVHLAGAAAVADRLGVRYDLGEHRSAQVAFIRQNPALDRATRSLGEATYANGQAWFAERGITSVDLYRRAGAHDDRAVVTSWAASEGATFNAPEHGAGRQMRHEAVPVERVFSHVAAGLGALEEQEFLVFNEEAA